MANGGSATKHGRFWGEATAFLALFLDNAGVLIFLNAILVFTFNYPVDIILTRMIPGTAIGVLLGDLVYTWLAVRLARKTGRRDVTAMPSASRTLFWARRLWPRATRSSPGMSAWRPSS